MTASEGNDEVCELARPLVAALKVDEVGFIEYMSVERMDNVWRLRRKMSKLRALIGLIIFWRPSSAHRNLSAYFRHALPPMLRRRYASNEALSIGI